MIFRTGMHVAYAGTFWELFGFKEDGDGYWCAVLIDPEYDAQSGEPEPTIYVRDLIGITFPKAA